MRSTPARSIRCIAVITLARHGSGAFQTFAGTAGSLPGGIEAPMPSGQYDFVIRVVGSDIERMSSYVVMEETRLLSGVPLAELCGASGEGT